MAETAKRMSGKLIQFPQLMPKYQVSLTEEELTQIIKNAMTKKKKSAKKEKTNSMYKRNGVKKSTPADPIRTKEDFHKIVDYLASNGPTETRLRNETIFVLGCSVGLRCGDLMRLKTTDVYELTGEIKKHLEIIEDKTNKRNVCKIPRMAAELLQRQFEEQKFDINEDTFLFASPKGGSLSLKRVYEILNEAGKACGFEGKISTHTMRKTYAMAALQSAEKDGTAGQTLEMLKMKFNHSDERITMHYVKADQDKMDKMSDRVSDWFEED